MTAAPTFAAARIAAALGISKRAVLLALDGVPCSRNAESSAQAFAWTFEQLPQRMQRDLETKAAELGHRNAAQMLSLSPSQVWQPPIPLAQIAQHSLDKAAKTQRALARLLALQNDTQRTAAEIEAIGLEDYRREFGHAISDRHLRELLKRTVARDGGAENFSRLELYLDERPARNIPLPAKPNASMESDFRELSVLITEKFKNAAQPSEKEIEFLWDRVWQVYAARIERGAKEKKTRRALVRFLHRAAPWLSDNEDALYKMLKRKLAQVESGESVADKRKLKEPTFDPFPAEDIKALVSEAGNNWRGKLLSASRRLLSRNELKDNRLIQWGMQGCPENASIYRRLLNMLSPQIRTLRKFVLDENAAKNEKPYLSVDRFNAKSMLAITCDDFTLPVRIRVPDGQGWWRLTRGQCILVADYSTYCILSFGLQEEEQPNSLIARTTITRAFQEHGLPEWINLERGQVFADSALVGGGDKARAALRSNTPFSDAEVSLGLRQWCKICVAQRPEGKPAERIGDLVQQLMCAEPGFTGIAEKTELPAETKYWSEELGRRNLKSLDYFYTLEEWKERVRQIFFDEFNHKRQGARTETIPGMTPIEAFQKKWNKADEPRDFPPELRCMLSRHKIPNLPVTDDGIKLSLRGKSSRYFDKQTGHWQTFIGKTVTAWIDPENPEFCTFTDSQMRNAFTVKRHEKMAPFDFDSETYHRESANAWAHANVGKRLYAELKRQPWQTFRKLRSCTPEPLQLAQTIEAEQTKRTEEKKQRNRITRRAQKVGTPAALVDTSARNLEAIEGLDEGLSELRREAQESAVSALQPACPTNPTAPKTYDLNPNLKMKKGKK